MKHTLAALLLAVGACLTHAAPGSFASDPAVIEFARDLEQRHGFSADELLLLVSENTGVDLDHIHVAIAYFADFPDEIDALVLEAEGAEQAMLRAI